MSKSIQEFYKDKTIFITGASGFMGKVLLEKLLYSCSDVKEILILMRPKRGKSGAERAQEFAKIPVFQRVNSEKPETFKKLVPVFGDITSKRLGLSEEQYQYVVSRTNVVFHMAASLKLEATLKPNVEMNLTGTKYVLDMCKEMKNLDAVIHLSTAFCNSDLQVMEEDVYDWKEKPVEIMKCAEWMTEEAMQEMSKTVLANHPNTYTYTKRLAEIFVSDEFKNSNLPLCIARPSIVTPAVSEPVPGWVDSLNGPIGIMVAGAKGVMRSMLCEAEYHAEVIPVDIAINGLIIIAQKIGTMKQRPNRVPVYNITCSEKARKTWGFVLDEGKRQNYEYPFEAGLWYPDGKITMNLPKHYLTLFFCQWLPALLIDFLMLIFFQPRFMIRVQKKIYVGLGVLQFFTTRRWEFVSENFQNLQHTLSEEDNKTFYTNTDNIDNVTYLKHCILGGRQYCLKEPLSTLPKARVQLKVLYFLNLALKTFLIYYFGKMFLNFTGVTETLNEIFMNRQQVNSSS